MTDEELIARLREKTVKKLPNNWQKGRKCPDCGSDATRPKCFFDYGPSCARHDPDAYDPPAWEVVPDPLFSAAADRIEALVRSLANTQADFAEQLGKATAYELRMIDAEARAERLEAALQFYSCKDGCNDCSENERDLIGCGWTARAALKGADHE